MLGLVFSRFKELKHVFEHPGQEGTSYALLTPAHFLKGDAPSCKRDTAGYLDLVKRVTTKKDHVDDLTAMHTGNEIFPSIYDPEYEGSTEERIKEVATGVQGTMVGSEMNTVCALLLIALDCTSETSKPGRIKQALLVHALGLINELSARVQDLQ